ncbi:MAG: hypothetical protein ABSF38_11600 [Verrucomicrobiota bacterium]|jgi:hypothetical protein
MKLLDILRRWLSQAEITAWEGLVLEMDKRQRDKEADLRTDVEAQGWRLDLGPEPFITLTSNLEIKPVGGNRFEKREPGGQWVRANPMRDFPQSDLVPLQRVGNLFMEWVHLQQGAHELPAAIEEFKREYQRHLDAARGASPAKLPEALEQLRKFYDEQKEALPLSPRKELLEMEFTILLDAFRRADSTKELEDLREQLRGFFRKHRESGADRWEELFIREEHQKEFRARLEEMRQAASPEDIARNKAQLLAYANKYGHYLPSNPLIEIQAAWTHALENNIPPAPPAGLRASVGREGGINLSWNNCPGATQYHTYRSESNAPESKSFLDSIPIPAAGSSPNPTFLDSSATAGRDYFYWVKATNPKGESDFTGPAKGSRLKPAGRLREPLPQTAPPEVTARMMKAMEEGDILAAIEIYTLNLAHAEIWVGLLDETLEICHENARGRKESGGAQVIADLLANHRSIQRKLRELIKADGNPVRFRTLTRISGRNNDFVAELEELLRNLNKEEADAKAEAEAEAKRVAQAKHLAEETARAEAEAIAKTTAVENQKLLEQALSEIEARCGKAETWDDIKAIKDSFILYHQFSQNEQFLSKWHELLTIAGTRVEEITTSKELHGKILAEVQTQSAQANSMADIHRIEHWMREQLDKLPRPDAGLEKQLALLMAEARKRVGPDGGTLANSKADAERIAAEARLAEEKAKAEAEAIKRQLQSVLNQATAAALAGKLEEVQQLIKSHPHWHQYLEPHLKWAEQIKKETDEAETQFQTILSRAAAAAAAGKPEEVQQLIKSHPQRREDLEPHLRRAEQVKRDAEEAERQFQSILSRAAAAAAAGRPEEVQQLIKSHPQRREVLEAHLRRAEQVQREAEEAERQFQNILSRARAAAAAGKPEEVQQLIKSHPQRREVLEPHLRRAEQVKKDAEGAEHQARHIVNRATDAAVAGKPEEVRKIIEAHPNLREQLEPHLRRAEQVKREAEEALRHIRQLQVILTRAEAAAAAGKPDEVEILIERHGPIREQLIPHLHEAIQVQVQARAKEAATPEDIEALKGLLQAHKGALKTQPMLVKALESLLAETEARVHAEIAFKLLKKQLLAEAKKRVEAAKSEEDIQLVNHWVDEEISRLPSQDPTLADELKTLVKRGQETLRERKEPAAQAGSDDWKNQILVRSQAKKFADEGDVDGVQSLIAAKPEMELQLVSFLQEAVGTQVRCQALCATTKADILALEQSIQLHGALLGQNVELAAECDALLQQARSAIKARARRRILILFLILAVLAAAGAVVGVMLSRHAPK